jgi:hypothetical protein
LPNRKPLSNSYKYLDPDYTYTEPKTGLLRNLRDISDPDVLLFVESSVVAMGYSLGVPNDPAKKVSIFRN